MRMFVSTRFTVDPGSRELCCEPSRAGIVVDELRLHRAQRDDAGRGFDPRLAQAYPEAAQVQARSLDERSLTGEQCAHRRAQTLVQVERDRARPLRERRRRHIGRGSGIE